MYVTKPTQSSFETETGTTCSVTFPGRGFSALFVSSLSIRSYVTMLLVFSFRFPSLPTLILLGLFTHNFGFHAELCKLIILTSTSLVQLSLLMFRSKGLLDHLLGSPRATWNQHVTDWTPQLQCLAYVLILWPKDREVSIQSCLLSPVYSQLATSFYQFSFLNISLCCPPSPSLLI